MDQFSYFNLISRYASQIYANGSTPELLRAFLDSLSEGQLFSKIKAIEILRSCNCQFNNSVFLGQWHGLLPYILHHEGIIKTGTGVESSPLWCAISDQINKDWGWRSIVADATKNLFWSELSPDLVVNTSAEHMNYDWVKAIKPHTYVLVQSTNFVIPEHINTVQSSDQLSERIELAEVICKEEQDFKVYKRFTVFGRK